MDNLVANKRGIMPNGGSYSWQTVSWSGANPGDNLMHPNNVEPQAFGGTLGFPPKIYMPSEQLPGHIGEDLQEDLLGCMNGFFWMQMMGTLSYICELPVLYLGHPLTPSTGIQREVLISHHSPDNPAGHFQWVVLLGG